MSIEDAAELPGRASHGGELPAGLWAALTWLARREGFAVELASGCHGDSMTSLSTRRILVRYGLDRPDSARALLHELGHVLMSDAVAQQPGKSPAGCRGIRKLEADSVAFAIAARLGMDTAVGSWPYVASWAGTDPRARPEETIRVPGEDPRIQFFSPLSGMLVSAGPQGGIGHVFYTTANGGRTWTAVPQGRSFTQLGTSFDFVSARTGFAWAPGADAKGSSPPAMYLTTDSGGPG